MSTTQRKLNLGTGPTKAMPAPPGSVAFRPPFHQRHAAEPRPDQRVHITTDQLPETAQKRFSPVIFFGSAVFAELLGGFFSQQVAGGGEQLASYGFAAVIWLIVAVWASWKCGACGCHASVGANRCKNCTSFLK